LKKDRPRIKVEIEKENEDGILLMSLEAKKKISTSKLVRVEDGYKITKLVWGSSLSSKVPRGKKVRYHIFFKSKWADDPRKSRHIISSFHQRSHFGIKVQGNNVVIWT
jgi:hypothetical protein